MKNKLLSSFLFVVSFWWAATYAWWYISLQSLQDFFHTIFIEGEFPAIGSIFKPFEVSFVAWTLPVLMWGAIVFLTTIFGVIFVVVFKKYLSEKKLYTQYSWRGIKVSLGEYEKHYWHINLPEIDLTDIDEYLDEKIEENYSSDIKKKDEKEVVQVFTTEHRNLMTEILTYIWLHNEDAFVGDGHGVSLLEHTGGVIDRCWTPNCDPLIPLAASAHDVGKILAWEKHKDSGEWKRVGLHDNYGKLIVSALDSFDFLTREDKELLLIAIGYSHKENKRPIFKGEKERRIEHIFSVINKNDRLQTKHEKAKVLENNVAPEMVTKAFLEALNNSTFNTPTTERGLEAICFRKGNTVYLLEPGFRDVFLKYLPVDVAAAYGGNYRRVGNMSPPSVALINHMKEIGWLVEDENGMHSECGLWSVTIGKKLFNGVLALTLPPEIIKKLPDETKYKIRFSCPLKVETGADFNPADRPSSSELSTEQKKTRQLSAITGQPMDELVKKMIAQKKTDITSKLNQVDNVSDSEMLEIKKKVL